MASVNQRKNCKLPPECTVADCNRKCQAKMMCHRHYRQVREHGHILTGNYLSEQGRKANASRKTIAGWKWAKEDTNHLERANFQYRCKQKVLARDDYTCQICLSGSEYLQVDHIKGWTEYPELRFDLDNLRTLCMPCHYYVTYKKKLPKGMTWGHRRIA